MMENLLFVVWLLGWPLVCSVTDRISPWSWEGKLITQSEVAVGVTVRILVWLGVAVLLYRQ